VDYSNENVNLGNDLQKRKVGFGSGLAVWSNGQYCKWVIDLSPIHKAVYPNSAGKYATNKSNLVSKWMNVHCIP